MLKSECRNCSKQELKDKNMLIKSIKIKGMLSFQDVSLDLRPLNVLIGPNASGKSNLIEIVALLQSLPGDLAGFVRQSGGISEWLWNGLKPPNWPSRLGRIETVLTYPAPIETMPLHYVLDIGESLQHTNILQEMLKSARVYPGHEEPFTFFHVEAGNGYIMVRQDDGQMVAMELSSNLLTPGQSVLHEVRGPFLDQEMSWVDTQLNAIHFYREWNIGRHSSIRKPQPTDAPSYPLLEDFSNLALVLNHLRSTTAIREIEANLHRFYENYEEVNVGIQANTAQLWIREKGLQNVIPATRLSDGTLRFLALLTILCHPTPPPLICIEEPELGLHPDIIPQVAKLLISASKRTQLIVTTHSKALIDQLWEDPESVVVCERDFDSGSEFKRLSANRLEKWLERYELGELWEKGEIGGNRW